MFTSPKNFHVHFLSDPFHCISFFDPSSSSPFSIFLVAELIFQLLLSWFLGVIRYTHYCDIKFSFVDYRAMRTDQKLDNFQLFTWNRFDFWKSDWRWIRNGTRRCWGRKHDKGRPPRAWSFHQVHFHTWSGLHSAGSSTGVAPGFSTIYPTATFFRPFSGMPGGPPSAAITLPSCLMPESFNGSGDFEDYLLQFSTNYAGPSYRSCSQTPFIPLLSPI